MSSNINNTTRSMNGIISIYSDDISVNKIDANEIDVNDLQINNSLEVNNITLSPETISFLDGATSNIQDQIDNINLDLDNYVDLTSEQTISGNKTFTGTTTLTGDLDVNNVSISPEIISFLDGATSNIQEQINNSVVGMTLDTDQTATGFKIFENGINTPFIQNSDITGNINGFLLNLDTILFSSYNGVWDNGVSIVSGGNVTNKILVDLDPNITPYNEATIETNDELQPIKATIKGYIPLIDTFLLKDVTNIQVLNGIVFNTTEDIINTITGNQITLQYNTGISQTPISINGTIIQIGTDYYLITNDSINVFDFIECANTTPLTETILNPAPNQYLLSYTSTAPTESTNVTINNFNYNNKLFTDSIAIDYSGKYAVDNLNIPYGSKLTASSDNSVYTFSINPSNQISIDDVYGFYDNGLFIFETTNITNPSTKSLLLQNTEEHGFISSISANNELVLSFDNFQTTLSATNHSYVKNLTGTPFMIIGTNKTDSYSNNSSISFIGSNLGNFSYSITSPNTITVDTPTTISVINYLTDANTIIFRSSTPFVVGDFYEIGANFGYQITGIIANNFIYTTSTNTNVNSSRDLVGVVVENFTNGNVDGTYSFLYSNFSPPPKINSPIINSTYAQENNICYISTNTRTNQTNSFGFTQTFNTVVSSPKRENKFFRYIVDAQGNYIFDADTKTIQLNDIVQYRGTGLGLNDDDNQRTGYHINRIGTIGENNTALYQYGGLYSENATSSYKLLTGTSDNLRYLGFNTSTPYFYVPTSKFTGSQPAVGDFIYFDLFDDGNYSYTYITSIDILFNNYWLYVNFSYNASFQSLTAYFYKPESQNLGIVKIPKLYNIFGRITYDEYTFNTSIDKYDQTNKFYTPQTYNLFENTTTKIYDEIAINEFPAIDFNIYQNYQYIFQTTKNFSLPAVAQNDTFVVENFAQNLSQKTFLDDTIFQQDIIGNGLLDMTDTTLEHQLGNVYIGAQYNDITNYGLSVGSSITDVNNFIISRNEDNNVTALNSKDILDLRVLNTQRIRIDTTYSTILNDLVLQQGYIQLFFRAGQSFQNGLIKTIQWTTNTLPTGFTKNTVSTSYSNQLTNNSGSARTLIFGGNLTLNGGTTGLILVWLGSGSNRILTFQAPLENGSTSVTISFTYKIGNGETIFFQGFQNSGSTRLLQDDQYRRSRLWGQVL